MARLRTQIIVLAVLPLLAALAAVGALLVYEMDALEREQSRAQEQAFLAAKREGLRNVVQLAMAAIARQYASAPDDAAARQDALAILRRMDFGADGYFFVYDQAGRNLMHPRLPELEGRLLLDLQDSDGVYVIRELLARAQEGGGFQRYVWPKPSTGQPAPKLGYAVMLDRWGWMLGTGLYLDDVEAAMAGWRRGVVAAGRETLVVLAMVAAVAIVSVFAGGLALNIAEQRRADRRIRHLADRVVLSQEEERARVSRELHDHVCQLLVSVKYRFELAARQVDAGDPDASARLRGAVDSLAGAIGTVRRISHELRPALLDDLGLDAALTLLAEDLAQRGGPQVALDLRAPASPPQAQAVALYRIAQEALANAERHAQASTLRLLLDGDDQETRLEIADDGRGFRLDGSDAGGGIGLSNMRQRAESLGGRLQVQSTASGTTVRVTLPRAPDPHRMVDA
ncbi:MAG: cache domain-containing protein [Burkholderiaceae bacterium]|nr:cache domain-containing protein [Burkholderiaceae bacterium]